MKSLEDELGATLLNRTKRRVELTEAGALFLDQARRALQHLERAGDAVRQALQGEAGEIRIAFTARVRADVRGFSPHRADLPHPASSARADLLHMSTGQQLQALADRGIDVGFLRPSPSVLPAAEYPCADAVERPPDGCAARGGTGWPARTRRCPWPHWPPNRSSCFPAAWAAACSSTSACWPAVPASRCRSARRAREGATIVGLVAAGTGVSILPETYAKTGIPGVGLPSAGHPWTPAARSCWRIATIAMRPLLGRFFEAAAASC